MTHPISFVPNGKTDSHDTIRWSTEASVVYTPNLGEPGVYNAFVRNSYLALVDFEGRNSDESVVVILPKGARALGHDSFVSAVHDAAATARSLGLRVTKLPDVPQGSWGRS